MTTGSGVNDAMQTQAAGNGSDQFPGTAWSDRTEAKLQERARRQNRSILFGMLTLGLGTSYYLICRSVPPTVLRHFALLHQCHARWLDIEWLGGFPTFAHTLGYTFLCTGLTCSRWQLRWALVWFATNAGAEVWSKLTRIGTFDTLDIAAAGLALILATPRRGV